MMVCGCYTLVRPAVPTTRFTYLHGVYLDRHVTFLHHRVCTLLVLIVILRFLIRSIASAPNGCLLKPSRTWPAVLLTF